MEWVEVRGKTVEIAVQAALEELGLESADQAEVKVVQEPERGFLGMGGRQAVVEVKAKPKRRRRTRGRSRDKSETGSSEGKPKARGGNQGRGKREGGRSQAPSGNSERNEKQGSRGRDQGERQGRDTRNEKPSRSADSQTATKQEEPSVTREEQAEVVKGFLVGLLDAYGLDGTVTTSVDDDIIIADVSGEQTEALVGPKGSILQSVHELARTVVQRQTHENVRLRLDIAGYSERRREALAIYAGRLAEQVKTEGAEVMLEPMNPADRKVIHDAVQVLEGVRSYSEGEEPRRSVVISPDE